MTTILNGILGGVIVGLLATLVTRVVGNRLGRDSELESGSDSTPLVESSRVLSGLLVGYGSILGGVFVALELIVLGLIGVPPTLAEAFGAALRLSVIAFAAAFLLWRFGSGASLTQSRRTRLLVYHLVYGLGFGAWIRLTWIT